VLTFETPIAQRSGYLGDESTIRKCICRRCSRPFKKSIERLVPILAATRARINSLLYYSHGGKNMINEFLPPYDESFSAEVDQLRAEAEAVNDPVPRSRVDEHGVAWLLPRSVLDDQNFYTARALPARLQESSKRDCRRAASTSTIDLDI